MKSFHIYLLFYIFQMKSSEDGVGNSSVDTALALTSDDLEVSLLTPAGTPGVLNQPVVLAVLFTVTDQQNTVVEVLGVADGRVGDTAGVELEVVSVEGNGKGTNFSQDGSNDGFVGRNISVVGGGGQTKSRVVLAGTVDTLVRISSFGFEESSFEVNESVVHKTTVATLVFSGVTINELLFGERSQVLAQLEDVLTFDGTSGGESPA